MEKNLIRTLFAVLVLIASAGMASAHFTMVFPSDTADSVWDVTPEDYIAELGETKTVYIMWGHPYEHISFNMASVPEVSVMKPDGTVEQLTSEEISVIGMDEDGNTGVSFIAYKASFTVDQMGDSVVFVKYEDEDENLIDYTKAVIHCGEEMWEGWDAEVGQQTEILSYMRPYGMEEGFVFAGKAMYNGQPLADAPVEVEIYHTLDLGIEIVETAEEMFEYDPNVRGVFIVPMLKAFPQAEESSASSISTAELQEAVDEAKQAAEEAKQAAAGTSSTPGFGVTLAVLGLVAALFIATRRT